MALNDKAMVANLTISQWTARKYDKKVSDEVEEAHGAKDAGRYNKALIHKDKLSRIQKAVGKLRTFHYFNTFPWSDNGERLLPSENYLDYVTELKVLSSEFNQAVKEFTDNYESYVQDARNRLGDMFNVNDYPSVDNIKGKFGIKPLFFPIPNPEDFRVTLDDQEVDKLKSSLEIEIKDRLGNAMNDAWVRIKEVLTAMKDKLSDKDAIFRNTLFDNVEDLVNLLPKMNITDDENLKKICVDMKGLIIDPDTVRSDNTIRSIKAQEVDNLMNKFKDFF